MGPNGRESVKGLFELPNVNTVTFPKRQARRCSRAKHRAKIWKDLGPVLHFLDYDPHGSSPWQRVVPGANGRVPCMGGSGLEIGRLGPFRRQGATRGAGPPWP
ncbi:unnamed protein product [Calypogeia fissa]